MEHDAFSVVNLVLQSTPWLGSLFRPVKSQTESMSERRPVRDISVTVMIGK